MITWLHVVQQLPQHLNENTKKTLSNGAFLINLHTLQHVTGITVVVSQPWLILSFI
jgi:hypothetical protein